MKTNQAIEKKPKKKNKTPNHMIQSKNGQNNTRFGHQQNVTKQQTTAIISKLTFRITQIRILSHFSSCHALFATPNLDASAVLLLRLTLQRTKKEFKEKQKNSAGILFFATTQLRMPFSSSSSSSSTPPPEEAQKQTNKPNKNNRSASYVATLNVSTPPNPPNSRLQFFWSSVGSFANDFCLIFFLFFPVF
jgi:hypothetical protein